MNTFSEMKQDQFIWQVSQPILKPGPKGSIDDISVKDPSIVFHEGRYHIFYTTKSEKTSSGYPATNTSLAYVNAPLLEELNEAPRIHLNEGGRLCPKEICAPQIFFFTPHDLWYLIAQVPIPGMVKLMPVFMTNQDISNPEGWSKPEIFSFQRKMNFFWIDFWIICDDENAHLFSTDHDGRMFRQETKIENFPYGFGTEEIAAEVRGHDELGFWRLHEASHIYRVKESGKYLCLIEAIRPHPLQPSYWDSRCRFMFALQAETLHGPWKRLEESENQFWGDPRHLFNPDGTPSRYDQISHPEAIRSGIDEKLEIGSENPDVLFQAFDASGIDEHFRYDFLPWELAIMKRQGNDGMS